MGDVGRAVRRDGAAPITWDELRDLVAVLSSIGQGSLGLGRNPQVQNEFRNTMAGVRQRFKSPNDYLFNRVFDQPTQVDPDSGLLTAGPPAATSLRLRDNDFPYDVTPDIRHCVLWAGSTDALQGAIANETSLRRYLPVALAGADLLWFVNPPHLQSVKGIPHAHIFARLKK
ncbi:Protein of unknown function (DUF3605) [Plasmodiophora brassicae]